MLRKLSLEPEVLGRGVYSAPEALRLLNFTRLTNAAANRRVSRQTVSRWLRGYESRRDGRTRRLAPLWRPDYETGDDNPIEVSFRDLIELRFVKAFRDAGLSLQTIRECFTRAVEEVRDERPFSTRRFRTDGKTIFLDITRDVREGEMIDLQRRQNVFRTIVEPSMRDLEFDTSIVARWFPLGPGRSIVIDPARAFGRPLASSSGVPTEVLAQAVEIERSVERAAELYETPVPQVRHALEFENRLAA
jgi:uncharacterized protein (DUF433 family)/DNA-binding transcriptional MerR regulator